MKTKTKLLICISCLLVTIAKAQFVPVPPGISAGRTIFRVQTIGIGNFPNLNAIQAKLHVDAFNLRPSTAAPFVNNGELFRTDGENRFDCQWQMFTGASQASLAQVGRVFSPVANPTWFTLEASQSNLSFNTGGTNERMAILGTNGFVAIGSGFTTPNYLLDVKGGDIDIVSNTQGFRIGGTGSTNDSYVLWFNGNTNNIYVANKAGEYATGNYNTFVGYNSGNTESSNDNTFTGYNTGPLSNGYENTLTGYNCGSSMTTAVANTFAGSQSGHNTTTGSYNTMTGRESGFYNTIGMADDFYGKEAGYHNVSGNDNCFYGNHSGWTNNDGKNNSAYGGESFYSNFNGNSNVSIGTNDMYSNYDGSANVSVGLGTMYSSLKGSGNVAIGTNADRNGGSTIAGPDTLPHDRNVFIGSGAVPSYLFGDSNVFVGSLTDVNTFAHNITNSGAIGFGAIATANNKFILGNNQQNIGIGMSNITGGPINKLEISYYSLTSPSPVGVPIASTFASVAGSGTATGTSGLQFRDLTDASIQYPYVTNQGFLTVDDKGNVVYMQSPTGAGSPVTANNGASINPANNVQLGQNFGAGGGPGKLLHYTEIPMNNFNLAFTDAGSTPGGGDITIGPPLSFQAKLGINNIAEYNGMEILSNTSLASQYGAYIINSGSSSTSLGTYSLSNCTGNSNYGIWAVGENASSYNYGGFFISAGAGTNNFGIYANASGGTNNYAGWFDGNVNVNGTLTVYGSPVLTSDIMFKTNIDSITDAMSIIKQLKPKSFNFDTTNIYGIHFPSQKQYGFVAQDVQPILPELVITSHRPEVRDSTGAVIFPAVNYKSLNYNAFFAILMKGMQEQERTINNDSLRTTKQQLTIDSLRTVLNSIQYCINRLCDSTSHSATQPNIGSNSENTTNITLSNSAILYQNTPNPFNEIGTKISYFLPENSTGASIVFYDMYGSKLNEVELTQTGMGTINVNPDRLSSGVYSYSLVINGQVIDTKKMVYAK